MDIVIDTAALISVIVGEPEREKIIQLIIVSTAQSVYPGKFRDILHTRIERPVPVGRSPCQSIKRNGQDALVLKVGRRDFRRFVRNG